MFKRKSTQRLSHENIVKSYNTLQMRMHLFPQCTPICQFHVPKNLQIKLLATGFLEEKSMPPF